ncbi:acyltransferase family protein [Halosquirtibacter xylanolyticus]|uniref:acyltransferase n=1 Tax=Halosquirtibacter xylanolyticus TaxID=3374599 RepID=UPI003748A2CC|nr:acyltransferase family protein [Prolixibacteraceae bacterium]
MNSRESSFDLLRIIACMMVVSSHTTSPYMVDSVPGELNFIVSNSIQSFCRVCIAIFVMIGGRYILAKKGNIDYQTFYSNTLLKRIIYPTLIWSVIYVIYCYVQGAVIDYMKIRPFDYTLPLKNWFMGRPYNHLWYMYMLIGLYASVPALMMIKAYIGEKVFLRLGILLLLLSPIVDYFSELFWMIRFIEFLGYFILGYSLRGVRFDGLSKRYLIAIWFVCSLMIASATRWLLLQNVSAPFYFYGFFTPFAMVGSLALYNCFDQLQLKKHTSLLSRLSLHSFRIYLIHAGLLSVVENVIFRFLQWNVNPLIYIPVTIIVVTLFSYTISYGVELLKRRYTVFKYF